MGEQGMTKMTNKIQQLWSLESAANELKCKVSTIREYIKRGELDSYWVAGKYMVSSESLVEFVESRKNITAPCGMKKGKKVGRRRRLARRED
jgi:hypothetical protein